MRADGLVDRSIGRAGALLVLMSIVVHLFGTIPAYRTRNTEDASTVVAVRTAPESIVLVDDEFMAQLLLPLYFGKTILLVDNSELGRDAARRLTETQAAGFLMVSRRATAQISLRPFDLYRIEPAGRMSIQFWRRQ